MIRGRFKQLDRQLKPASRDFHASLPATLGLTGALLVLFLVPFYHLLDAVFIESPADLLRAHALWRLPPFLLAIGTLIVCWRCRYPGIHKWSLRALALSVMTMVFGLFSVDLTHPAGDPSLMVRGIIICSFAASIVSLRGARELVVIVGLPFLGAVGWILLQSVDLRPLATPLIDVVMAVLIAAAMSEVFARVREHQYDMEQSLERQAETDALTGLPNRHAFDDRLARELGRSRRHGEALSVVIGDLDHFKRINDEFGHAAGDEVLRVVGERIMHNIRAEDLAVRWGGEEFLLLLPATDAKHARIVAEKVRAAIGERPIDCGHQEIAVTASFGVAELQAGEVIDALVRRADDAMYRAKEAGRNRVALSQARPGA